MNEGDNGDNDAENKNDQIHQEKPAATYDYLAEKAKNIEKNREILKQMGLLNASDSVLGHGDNTKGGKGKGKGKGRKGKKANHKSRLIRNLG